MDGGLYRRQRSRGIHSVTSKVAAALIGVAAIGLSGGLVSGCGSNQDPQPQVNSAPDRSDQISALKRKVARLKRKRQKATAARERQAEKADEAASEGLDSLVAGLPGEVGVVTAGPGGAGSQQSGGPLVSGPAWSTIKVPIAERVLGDAGGPSKTDATTRNQITAAVTQSDNDAAAALFSRLESIHGGLAGASEAVGQMLRDAGDGSTVVSTRGRDGFSTYGQTEWSLSEQNRYLAALAGGCVSDSASRKFLLDQMATVGGSDTFGLGSTGLAAQWKGGWGPGIDGRYLVRQMGVIDAGAGPVVVAMAAIPDDGTFESGQAILNEIAARVVSRYSRNAPVTNPC